MKIIEEILAKMALSGVMTIEGQNELVDDGNDGQFILGTDSQYMVGK